MWRFALPLLLFGLTAHAYAPLNPVQTTVSSGQTNQYTSKSSSSYSPSKAQFGSSVATALQFDSNKGGDKYHTDTAPIVIVCSPGSPSLGSIRSGFGVNNDGGICEAFTIDKDDKNNNLQLAADTSSGGNWIPDQINIRGKFGSSVAVRTDIKIESRFKNKATGTPEVYIGEPNQALCEKIDTTVRENVGKMNGPAGYSAPVANWGSVSKYSLKASSFDIDGKVQNFQWSWANAQSEMVRTVVTCSPPQTVNKVGADGTIQVVGASIDSSLYTKPRNLYGFSAHISPDGEWLVHGAPMFRYGMGNVVMSKWDGTNYQRFQPTGTDNDGERWYAMCDKSNVKKSFDTVGDICSLDALHGYAVGSMALNGQTYIVSGAPRAMYMKGEIRIVKIDKVDKELSLAATGYLELARLEGDTLNSGFGTAVLGLDIDGDGNDELIVGEQFYQNSRSGSYNMGRITIYKYDEFGQFQKTRIESPDEDQPGQFGATLTSLGDIDADGYNDFAVASTNADNGVGKVYLYSGHVVAAWQPSRGNYYPDHLQMITAPSSSKLFGYAMDGNSDLDLNGFNDLAITAPASASAAVYVYYSENTVRVVKAKNEQMKKVYQFNRVEDQDCDADVLDANPDYNFCFNLRVPIQNNGYTFKQDFQVEVSISSPNAKKFIPLKNKPQTASVFQTEHEEFALFPVLAKIEDGRDGETIQVNINTKLKSGQIQIATPLTDDSLREITYRSNQILADSDFTNVQISVGSNIDLSMTQNPSLVEVILGDERNAKKTVVVTLQRKSGADYILGGQLDIDVGGSGLKMTTFKTEPANMMSCTQSNRITCRIDKTKFTGKIDLILDFSVLDLARGEETSHNIPVQFKLHWNNRDGKEDDRASGFVVVSYKAAVLANVDAPSVSFDKAYSLNNRVMQKLTLSNSGPSSVGATEVTLTPMVRDGLEARISPASHTACVQTEVDAPIKCLFTSITSNENYQAIVVYTMKSSAVWSQFLTEAFILKTDYEWNVNSGADYETDINLFPITRSGAGEMVSEIFTQKAPFPWWALILSLCVSVIIVAVIVVVLYKKGFFKKRDVDKLRLDDINNDDVVDADNEQFKYDAAQV